MLHIELIKFCLFLIRLSKVNLPLQMVKYKFYFISLTLTLSREAMETLTLAIALHPEAMDVLGKDKTWQAFVIDLVLLCREQTIRLVENECQLRGADVLILFRYEASLYLTLSNTKLFPYSYPVFVSSISLSFIYLSIFLSIYLSIWKQP